MGANLESQKASTMKRTKKEAINIASTNKDLGKNFGGADDAGLEPGLYVIATPIGNMEDITYRAVRMLKSVDALATEDTRVTSKLLLRYGIAKPSPTFSCFEHNELRAVARIRSLVEEGKSVVDLAFTDSHKSVLLKIIQTDIFNFSTIFAISSSSVPNDRDRSTR